MVHIPGWYIYPGGAYPLIYPGGAYPLIYPGGVWAVHTRVECGQYIPGV